jgi:hypothetical protein
MRKFLYAPTSAQAPELRAIVQKAPAISPKEIIRKEEKISLGEAPAPKKKRRKRKFVARGKM